MEQVGSAAGVEDLGIQGPVFLVLEVPLDPIREPVVVGVGIARVEPSVELQPVAQAVAVGVSLAGRSNRAGAEKLAA